MANPFIPFLTIGVCFCHQEKYERISRKCFRPSSTVRRPSSTVRRPSSAVLYKSKLASFFTAS
ncbi:MAG TPA: hypothetical protein ENJ53_06070 [Phaeodactylibacter sp.]|nr:hypothetical protein [Phaeodactylibacter sp.]